MKKILTFMIVSITLLSCGGGQSESSDTKTSVIEDTSVQHPNGMTQDRAISTDTAAFGVNANRADSTKK